MKIYHTLLITFLVFAAAACTAIKDAEPEPSNTELTTKVQPVDDVEMPEDSTEGDLPEVKSKDAKASREQIEAKDAATTGLGPTDALRAFNDAVIKKDAPKIRSLLSRASLKMIEKDAKDQGKTVDAILTAEDGAPMPVEREMQNEKIDGDNATVEVKNSVLGNFETMFMVKEDGNWRVALDKIRADMIRRMNEMQKAAPKPGN